MRSPELLRQAVELEDPTQKKYQPHDVTGDGLNETFCNQFLEAVAARMGCPLPKGLRANEQLAWLDGAEAKKQGWEVVSPQDAARAAVAGELVACGWPNPGGHGHVGVVRETSSDAFNLRIAQAGGRCFVDEPISHGFGSHPVRLWRHK